MKYIGLQNNMKIMDGYRSGNCHVEICPQLSRQTIFKFLGLAISCFVFFVGIFFEK
jgi:hypothetical protein